ncbi:MAG TPA: PA domain-containing protein, partial [Candidatus Angelobacter sp.]|nr:PA domain-containing protein [Candidatus Angelobacter sp.]
MKRAKLIVVVISVFVLSSFALQNSSRQKSPAPSVQSAVPQASPASGTATQGAASQVSAQGIPATGIPTGIPSQGAASQVAPTQMFGFRDFAKQYQVDQQFLASPSPARAEQHLKILTAVPHIAGSPEDKATADHVAKHFDIAGLQTAMVKYSVWMNRPEEISVTVTAPANVKMSGPRPEHVDGDPLPDNPRVVMPFNGSSPSGDVEAEVVYANYGRPEDFKKLEDLKIDVRGKIVIVRYGDNFRGVKSFVAEEHGAAGVIIYSDPIDDGYFKGDAYPKGPWRPESGVQRGSIQYMFKYPGD